MAVNKEMVKIWLTEKGFSKWAVFRVANEEQYMDSNGVNLFINFDVGNFRMEWMIHGSIFKIASSEMSPVWRLDHLDKMYNRFLREVLVHSRAMDD